MTATSLGDLDAEFAAFVKDPAVDDPYSVYRHLRELDPVHYSQHLSAWVVTSYEGVDLLTKEPRWSSAARSAATYPGDEGRSHALCMIDKMVSHTDPPDHSRLRRLTNRTFSTRAAESRRA